MHVSELDTPALLIDLDIFERNLQRVADYAKANDLRLRPHTKTHKVPAVGRLQIESHRIQQTPLSFFIESPQSRVIYWRSNYAPAPAGRCIAPERSA